MIQQISYMHNILLFSLW